MSTTKATAFTPSKSELARFGEELGCLEPQAVAGLALAAKKAHLALKELASRLEVGDLDVYKDSLVRGELLVAHLVVCEALDRLAPYIGELEQA